MKRPILIAVLAFASGVAAIAATDPAAELRKLDQMLEDGLITKTEHDARWRAVIAEGTTLRAETSPSVPKLARAPRHDRALRWQAAITPEFGAIEADGLGEAFHFSLDGSIGCFATPNLLLSAGIATAGADFDDETTFVSVAAVVSADFYFAPEAKLSPFIGGGFAWAAARIEREWEYDEEFNDTFWIARAGLRHTLRRHVALIYQVSYRAYDDSDYDFAAWGGSVGLAVRF